MNTTDLVSATGRLWGFTSEIDQIERVVSRALLGKAVTFEITQRSRIGERGFFNKRYVSKYEYRITGPDRRQVALIGDLIDHLARELS